MKCPKCENKSYFKVDAWEEASNTWFLTVEDDGSYQVDEEKYGCGESDIDPDTGVQCYGCGAEGTQEEFGFNLKTSSPGVGNVVDAAREFIRARRTLGAANMRVSGEYESLFQTYCNALERLDTLVPR